MKLRNKKSYFTAMPEDKPPENVKSRITSMGYFALLAFIGIYFLYFMAGRFFYEEGRGQIEVASHKLHAPGPGLISWLSVSEGDEVVAGQAILSILSGVGLQPSMLKDTLKVERDLAELEAELAQVGKASVTIKKISRREQAGDHPLPARYTVVLLPAVVKVHNAIMRDKAQLDLLRSQRVDLNNMFESVHGSDSERILELSRFDRRQHDQYQQQLQKLDFEIASQVTALSSQQVYFRQLVEVEKSALQQKMAALERQRQGLLTYLQGLQNGGVIPANGVILKTPVGGEVSAVFFQDGDMVKAGDTLASVTVPFASVTIQGYFNMKQLSSLHQGDTVKVLLPDGQKSRGVIVTMHSAASPYLNKIKDGYVPIESSIFVEISPENSLEAGLWKQYDRMDVELKVRQ